MVERQTGEPLPPAHPVVHGRARLADGDVVKDPPEPLRWWQWWRLALRLTLVVIFAVALAYGWWHG